ncbi:Lrp/AsnC family transcriptional regulator [Streptomyces sp. NPDC046909]|uniref:Lrp/AsnC family transcriptional regulator n=1 Tax=Streptomyces sp. NPDC046909 TaxID=3155617 RepID=UPI0033CD62FD
MDPRPLDALDLKLMQALQLDGRAPFSRIGEVLGVSDQTVARRYRRLRTTAGLRVVGVVDEARLGRASWVVRLRCTPDVAEQLANALARRADTSYIELISGGTEVLCAMKPRSRKDRDELLFERLPRTPRVVSVSAHCLLHVFYGGPLSWLDKIQALDADEERALRPSSAEPPGTSDTADTSDTPDSPDTPSNLDAGDEALVALLRRDGRAPYSELQAATGLPESAVKRRVERLRSSGLLYFDIQHDTEPFGQGVGAMLWLTVAPSALADVGQALGAHREVRFAAAITGQANLVAAVLCRSTGDLYAYLSEKIGALDGVRSVETTLTLRQVKQLTYEPAPR